MRKSLAISGDHSDIRHTSRARRVVALVTSSSLLAGLLLAATAAPAADLGPSAMAAGLPDIAISAVDVNAGPAYGNPTVPIDWNGGLYFSASDGFACNGGPAGNPDGSESGQYGEELWTLASSGGPTLVADLNRSTSGNCGGITGEFQDDAAGLPDALLFRAQNNPFGSGSTGFELYRAPGASGPAGLVQDIWPGSFSSQPRGLTTVLGGTRVAFSADHPTSGREAWISDGTSLGTTLVANIAAADTDSNPAVFTPLDDARFVFVADDDVYGVELFVSTGSGATLVRDIRPTLSTAISHLTPFDGQGKVVFFATDGTSGEEPWVSDGTAAGTLRLADINSGSASSKPYSTPTPPVFVQVGDTMFFHATDPINGLEIWATDGTPDGTRLVKDLNPGSGGGFGTAVEFQGTLWFGGPGIDLWTSDGTADGTTPTGLFAPGSLSTGTGRHTVVGDLLYFTIGATLWVTDGSPEGTESIPYPFTIGPTDLTAIGDDLLAFRARDDAHGSELFIARKADLTPPTAPAVAVGPSPARQYETVAFTATVDEAGTGGSLVLDIQARVDGGPWTTMTPLDGGFDSPYETGLLETAFSEVGTHTLCARATDSAGNTGAEACIDLEVEASASVPLALTITRVARVGAAVELEPELFVVAQVGDANASTRADSITGAEVEPFWTIAGTSAGRNPALVSIEVWEHDGDTAPPVRLSTDPAGGTGVDLFVDTATGKWEGDLSWPRNCSTGVGDLAVEVCFDISVWSESGDRDGDGLLDSWELYGLNADGDDTIDLPLPSWGADIDHKDIFVEYDWRKDSMPPTSGLARARATAAAAPVDAGGTPNPDGLPGINLWVDGPNADPMGGGSEIEIKPNCGVDDEFYRAKRANFDPLRRWVFHYAIKSVDTPDDPDTEEDEKCGIGGQGEYGGNDFIVYNDDDFGESFLHELGHNLRLGHGGDERGVNRKPNYVSIMNYAYSFSLADLDGNKFLDFARIEADGGGRVSLLPDLDEQDLDETAILGADHDARIIFVNGQCSYVASRLGRPIDWNGDGDTEDASVANPWLNVDPRDIDDDGNCPDDEPFDVHTASDDWANVVLAFHQFGDSLDGPINPIEEPFPTDEEFAEMTALLHRSDLAISLAAGATAAPGTTSSLEVTVANIGPNAADEPFVTLQVPDGIGLGDGDHGCTAPVPGTIACTRALLFARESDTFEVPLSVPADATGTLVIDAQVADLAGTDSDPSNNADGVEIGVVSANTPPEAGIAGGPYIGALGAAIVFDGTISTDADGDPLRSDWDWGDGTSLLDAGSTPAHAYDATGIYDVCLTVTDPSGDSSTACTSAVVYDPTGGFVTGGGWFESDAGSCQLDAVCAGAAGRAEFAFVSRYQKGATVPSGNAAFQFRAGGLDFASSALDWLVVSRGGSSAQFKGTGTANGAPAPGGSNYRFMIWAADESPDTFRIRIWYDAAGGEVVVYDNGFGQALGGGSIKVHSGR